MNSEKLTICPICENENFEFFLKAKDHTVTQEEFELKKCTRCHLLFTSPRPTETTIGKYYASDNYISHSGKSNTLFDSLYLAARRITLKWKTDLINQYTLRHGRVLDFGCGTGDFLLHLQNSGYQVSGVEPNKSAREKANIKLHGKVSENLLEIKNGSVDVITLWHVLEHVHTLNETLQGLKKRTKKGGHIIIAVPNPSSHDALKYKSFWAGYDVPRHLWHLTQETMNALLIRNGLKIVSVKPMKLDSFYVSLLSEQYRLPKQLKIISATKALAEGVISNLKARKKKEYSSLIYIAQPE
jgi:2-polyprenyl-3-methyl-5-hydroxy-6-metoxy-1,4-benzoquinol methylase